MNAMSHESWDPKNALWEIPESYRISHVSLFDDKITEETVNMYYITECSWLGCSRHWLEEPEISVLRRSLLLCSGQEWAEDAAAYTQYLQ